MKHHLACATATALALFAALAQAGPISEDFDYAAGAALSNQNGGTGWLGSWSAASNFVVAAGSLSYPGLSSSGNRGVYSAGDYSVDAATRYIGTGADGTTLWLSFLLRADGNPDGLTSYLSFGDLQVGKIASDSFWGVGRNGTADVLSTSPIVPGTSALFVMRFDFNADPAANDTVSIYIDPPAGASPGAPVASYTSLNFSSGAIAMDWVGYLNNFNATPDIGSVSLDGFSSGDSYAAVAPAAAVPEATPAALMALGLVLVGAAARSQRRHPCGILPRNDGQGPNAAADGRDPAAPAVR